MTQSEKLTLLIDYLQKESPTTPRCPAPSSFDEQKTLFRSLVNIRPSAPISDDFLLLQDDYLKTELEKKRLTSLDDLEPLDNGLYLWQGDITTLKVDAIVNAANSSALGCFIPCHNCIDNIIHTVAGVQLRLECDTLMRARGKLLGTGEAIITGAYNLPARFVLHTVGPIVTGRVTQKACEELAACYRSCLALCKAHSISSVAFCCISTGVFHFPNDAAATIAIKTVQEFLKKESLATKVLFNVFKEEDYLIYKKLLKK